MARINLTMGRRTTKDPLDADYVQAMNNQLQVIQENFKAILKGTNNLLPGALEHAVQPIFDESQRLVPVDTGKLKASGFVNARQTARGAKVDIGYGKGDHPNYTVFVHERTYIDHDSPTQAKFLEAAVFLKMGEILPRVQSYMKSALGT